MQEQIRLLVELQKVDAVLGEMKKKREETPKRLSEQHSEVEVSREELERLGAELDELGKERKTKEGLLQMEVERVHRSEERLKEIKTQKEYHALLKEIDQGKKLNASREEDILRLISDIEEREKVIDEKKGVFKTKEKAYNEEKSSLEKELAVITTDFDSKKKEWEEKSKRLKPNILKVYQRVSERKSPTSIVPVKNGACTGCHMNLPPQLYNQVQKGSELIQCPACHRILYWEGKAC